MATYFRFGWAVVPTLLLYLSLNPVCFAHDLRVLVSTRTTGFRHGSIQSGISMLTAMAQRHGWRIRFTEDADAFTNETLANTDVIVFLNTTGNVVEKSQREHVEQFIRSGGGFVGIHSASDSEYDWPFYADLIGAYFKGHPAVQPATIHVLDTTHPSTAHLRRTWVRTDEWYDFRRRPRDHAHVLMVVDERTYEGGAMGMDHAIAWCKSIDAGRSFYTAGGHTGETFSEDDFIQHVYGGIVWASGRVPGSASAFRHQNYTLEPVVQDLNQPIALRWIPGNRLLALQRTGELFVIDRETGVTYAAGGIATRPLGEDGALGLAIERRRTDSIIFYVSIADNATSTMHVFRCALDDRGLLVNSPRSLLQFPYDATVRVHLAGALVANPRNGDLYFSTGDNSDIAGTKGYPPLDERPGRQRFDAQRTSSNTNSFLGKILRIRPNLDGSGYTIPEGNLFPPGQPQTLPEIYCMGLRNPFRFGLDEQTGNLLVGDVGPDATHDSDIYGAQGHDEFTFVPSASNLGWPYFIADNRPYNLLEYSSTGDPRSRGPVPALRPTNHSPNNTGITVLPPARPATYWYAYGNIDTSVVGVTDGRSVAAACRIVPPSKRSKHALPEQLAQSWLYYDIIRGYLRAMFQDSLGRIAATVPLFYRADTLSILDVEYTDSGEVYVVVWDRPRLSSKNGSIQRLHYSQDQTAPICRIRATPLYGPVPLTVQLSASESTGDIVKWRWTIGSIIDSTSGPTATVVLNDVGTYPVRLMITDTRGRLAYASTRVTAGHSPPQIESIVPRPGTVFNEESNVEYVVQAVDDRTPTSLLRTEVSMALGHDNHSHPVDVSVGPRGWLMPPHVHNHGEAQDLYAVMQISVRDGGYGAADALSSDSTIILQPQRKEAEHGKPGIGASRREAGETTPSCMALVGPQSFFSISPLVPDGIAEIAVALSSSSSGRLYLRANTVDGVDVCPPIVFRASEAFQTLTTAVINRPDSMHSFVTVFEGELMATACVDYVHFRSSQGQHSDSGDPLEGAIRIRPNPSQDGELLVQLRMPTMTHVTYAIWNSLGQMVTRGTFHHAGDHLIRLTGAASGAYILVVSIGDVVQGYPFIVSR